MCCITFVRMFECELLIIIISFSCCCIHGYMLCMRWTSELTFQRGEVELHKQPCLSVSVSRADPDDDRVTVVDLKGSGCGNASGARTLSTYFPTAAIVNGHSDGLTVVQSWDWDLGAIFSAKLHRSNLSWDGVVGHIVKREGIEGLWRERSRERKSGGIKCEENKD